MIGTEPPTELDSRTADRIEVRLLWHPSEDRVTVAVLDARSGETLEIGVRADESALDVFHHPYAYAAYHGEQPRPQPTDRLSTVG